MWRLCYLCLGSDGKYGWLLRKRAQPLAERDYQVLRTHGGSPRHEAKWQAPTGVMRTGVTPVCAMRCITWRASPCTRCSLQQRVCGVAGQGAAPWPGFEKIWGPVVAYP